MSINKSASSIKDNVGKSLLLLNKTLPKDKGFIWVTVQEMGDRLVYCGVNSSLTVDMVAYFLKNSNRGNCISYKRENSIEWHIMFQTFLKNSPFFQPIKGSPQITQVDGVLILTRIEDILPPAAKPPRTLMK
jgi:hypothetical protein